MQPDLPGKPDTKQNRRESSSQDGDSSFSSSHASSSTSHAASSTSSTSSSSHAASSTSSTSSSSHAASSLHAASSSPSHASPSPSCRGAVGHEKRDEQPTYWDDGSSSCCELGDLRRLPQSKAPLGRLDFSGSHTVLVDVRVSPFTLLSGLHTFYVHLFNRFHAD